jgi:hypothetical protein
MSVALAISTATSSLDANFRSTSTSAS